MRLLFVLPGAGGGGGSHSVMQEAIGLQRLGVDVAVATTRATLEDFLVNYGGDTGGQLPIVAYDDATELSLHLVDRDIVCATTWGSVALLQEALAIGTSRPRTAYYVQDYEPLFCAPGSPEWTGARASYTALDGATLFAKTRFLCELVSRNHGVPVERVQPSLDHRLFFPGAPGSRPLTISAMIRPKTPRRAPRRTVRILETIAHELADVRLLSFGASAGALAGAGLRPSPRIDNRGQMRRGEVAELLRETDLFLDLSDYQAFGRTGLEAMACGCVPMLPIHGGANEYVRHWQNGLLIDTRSDAQIIAAVKAFAALDEAGRDRMRMAAIRTALDYSVERAAFSELELFNRIMAQPAPASHPVIADAGERERADHVEAERDGEHGEEAP
jgi:glycosyltransferase involved in cell wall biosynthesis